MSMIRSSMTSCRRSPIVQEKRSPDISTKRSFTNSSKSWLKTPKRSSLKKDFHESLEIIDALQKENKKLKRALNCARSKRDQYHSELVSFLEKSRETDKLCFSIEKDELIEASSKLLLNASKNRKLLGIVNDQLGSLKELISNQNFQYALLKVLNFSDKLVKKYTKVPEYTNRAHSRVDQISHDVQATLERTKRLLSIPQKVVIKNNDTLDFKLDAAERRFKIESASKEAIITESLLVDNSNQSINKQKISY